jgi:hypothetical protein
MPRILGIDPGVTGGIASIRGDFISVHDIPVAGGEINIDLLVKIIREEEPDVAIIERASSMPKQGVASTFKFGIAYGTLRAVVSALEIPHHLVTPATWKKHFRLSADKEKSRALAIRLWPGCGLFNLKKHHGRAEAALIARYGAEVLLQRRDAA